MTTEVQARRDDVDTSIRPRAAVAAIAVVGLVAFLARAAPYAVPEAILWIREYDDAVTYAGAVALLQGLLPYAGFDYMHPPGSLLFMTPFAALGMGTTEAVGLAAARLVTIAVGVANTVLIGVLLRRRGVAAVVVGAGLYAVWGNAVVTERTYLLEPYLNLFLLAALIAVSTKKASAPFVAGAALGVAVVTKYWAVLDVALVGWMVAAQLGRIALIRYLGSGVVVAGAIGLPFFLADPTAMWTLTVEDQLGRSGTGANLAERASFLSPFYGSGMAMDVIPTTAWVILLAPLLVIAVVPVVRALRARLRPGRWSEDAWWGVIVLAHAVLLGLGSVFHYHYATWLIAPLALSLGAAAGRLRSRRARRAVVGGSLIVLAVMAFADVRAVTPTPSATALAEWARGHECVAGLPPALVAADRVADNLAAGCPMDIDPLSLGMTLPTPLTHGEFRASDEWRETWASYAEGADGLLLGPSERRLLTADDAAGFARRFEFDGTIGDLELWSRRAD